MARTVRRSEVVEGVHLVENGVAVLPGWTPCVIKQNITFSTKRLQEYCFVPWEPIIYDVLLVAAAVEFCDKLYKRPTYGWRRTFAVRIPVHEPERSLTRSASVRPRSGCVATAWAAPRVLVWCVVRIGRGILLTGNSLDIVG